MPTTIEAKPSLLNATQYRRFADLVYELTRINLGNEKQELVAARVSKRLRHLKLSRYEQYEALITGPDRNREIPHLIDVISTHHTYFYRESSHFDFISGQVVPEIQARKQAAPARFWSAACSTGEEPATLAITLTEAGLSPESWEIHCTDIASQTVAKANRGIFLKTALDRLPPQWRTRYFQKGLGEWQNHCRLKTALRKRMRYSVLNLASAYEWDQPFDVILIRNVMIYFDRPTQTEVLNRALRFLRPGGFLITGQSESLAGMQAPLQPVRNSVYQFKP